MTTNQSAPSVIVIDDDTDDENIAVDITPIDHKRKFEREAVKDADEHATIKCQKTTEEFSRSQTESLEALGESSESESEEIIGTQKLYDSDDEEEDDDAVSCDKDTESEGENLSFKRFLQRAFPSDDANAKGKAFEEFLVDWFLKTYPEYKTKFVKVWPYADWPKPRSDIPDVDEGIDIIAQDTEGKICAIQAKCWNTNSKLPYGELATFLASSSVPYIDYRLLIATCDVGRKAARQIQLQNEQKQIHAFLLSDFARWDIHWPESLDALRDFIPRQPHEPEPHQLDAIDAVCEGLAEHGKGQLIMACGTGKTLTGQRIAEKLASKTTLVLVPSLVLLNNTMTNWLTERKQDFVFLVVCSDKSVAKRKDTSFTTTDLHCRVTTTPAEIADFLNQDANTNKVIFSTYQSSPRIADAFESGNLGPFDLVIADEAHRCAGKVSADFSTVLKAERMPAKYRLFMTATPKLYTSRVSEIAGEYDIDVASMDDASLFGPVLHRLTFREAIDKELLADYRVVVVGVNEARYRDMVDERVLVKTECGSFKDDAKTLAARLGLAHTIQTYDLNRVITFHSRVKRADEFSNGFKEFLNVMKPEFKPTGAVTYKHVSGEMPTSQRSRYLREMRELENEDRYLLANCQCLSEGVDVPALDGVAFLDPKNAEVDIVQAVGRVMRRNRTRVQQKNGTIVIPIFISDEDDVDKALNSSNFRTVWKVVRALRSHDEVLGQELDQRRVKLGRERASGNIDLTLNNIHFDLHETVGDDFLQAFKAKTVEMTTSSWEEYFSALVRYKAGEGNGDPNCSRNYLTKDTSPLKLGSWLRDQRKAKKGFGKGKISVEQIRRLEKLGVWWEQPDSWDDYFSALKRYKAGEGNSDPNCLAKYETKDTPPLKLGSWLSNQRTAKKGFGKGKISVEQIRRLEKLGVWWEQPDSWEDYSSALVLYKAGEGNGDPNCPQNYVTKDTPPLKLGSWLSHQRKAKKGIGTCKISVEQIHRLEELGVWWENPYTYTWGDYFSALVRYKTGEGNGDPNCSTNHVTKDTPPLKLGIWLSDRRRAKKGIGTCKISVEQIRRLEELGVWWENPYTYTWGDYFSALVLYKAGEGNGDPNCPQNYVTKDTPPLKLGSWLSHQRKAKKGIGTCKISVEQIHRLEELGVWWENPYTYTWGDYFSALVRYKTGEGNGDPNCPQNYVTKDTPPLKLGSWLSNQRTAKKGIGKGKISVEQIRRLEELGVWWEQPDSWEDYFSALVRYKAGEGNGDPNCTFNYVSKDVPALKLGNWLVHQRTAKRGRKGYKISVEQIRRLEELGVWWEKDNVNHNISWEDNFRALER
ncbi:unnamed protein product [Bathycoccus prasinos]